MIPEFNALERAIEKKRRHTKSRACSAGIDEIRKALKEYKEALERSRWYRAKRFYLDKMGPPRK